MVGLYVLIRKILYNGKFKRLFNVVNNDNYIAFVNVFK